MNREEHGTLYCRKRVRAVDLVKRSTWGMWIVIVTLFAGCAGTGDMIQAQSVCMRTGVYQELKEETVIPSGFSDLRISFSVKTHTSTFYILEKGTHGTPDYDLVLNIDCQAEKVKGNMTEENTLDERPQTPETGRGIRYRFRKDLRLMAGNHNVFVAVPQDQVVVEVEIRLEDGTRNELVLEPVYAIGKRFGTRGQNFYSHLSGIRMLMNGKPL